MDHCCYCSKECCDCLIDTITLPLRMAFKLVKTICLFFKIDKCCEASCSKLCDSCDALGHLLTACCEGIGNCCGKCGDFCTEKVCQALCSTLEKCCKSIGGLLQPCCTQLCNCIASVCSHGCNCLIGSLQALKPCCEFMGQFCGTLCECCGQFLKVFFGICQCFFEILKAFKWLNSITTHMPFDQKQPCSESKLGSTPTTKNQWLYATPSVWQERKNNFFWQRLSSSQSPQSKKKKSWGGSAQHRFAPQTNWAATCFVAAPLLFPGIPPWHKENEVKRATCFIWDPFEYELFDYMCINSLSLFELYIAAFPLQPQTSAHQQSLCARYNPFR